MSVNFDRESPGKFDSRTLSRETLNRWTGRRVWGLRTYGFTRRHQTCHFRKRTTSVPAEGPAYGLDFARHREYPLRDVHRSRTFGAA